jgi:dipeptidase D
LHGKENFVFVGRISLVLFVLLFLLSPDRTEGQTPMNHGNNGKMLEGLEPRPVWEHFLALSRIPRCSGNEARAREYVLEVAASNGCAHVTDRAGNTVVRKKAAPGMEARPVVVLQSHLDMVCEKNKETAHDFSRDPIRWRRDGDWIGAEGTTLGADNGIGVAVQLAVLDDRGIAHGPLELLFTVDEETGLTGANGLAPDLLEGRILLNLDSEDEETLYIGCAGGRDTVLSLPLETEPAPGGAKAASIRLGGLQGGHSGLEIDRGRGNAIKLLARFLAEARPEPGLRIACLDGGSKRNAIPRECDALVFVSPESVPQLEEAAREFERIAREEYKAQDPGLSLRVQTEGVAAPARVFRKEFESRLLDLLLCMPHGVLRMSADIAGLVQTSTNLAVIQTLEKEIVISTSQRSSVASELKAALETVAAAGRLAGARVRHDTGYPGWKPNPGSPLLGRARAVYPSVFGKEPKVTAIHAGLECGIIGARFPGMDMISFGPTVLGAHSPDERVHIPSVKRFWDLLSRILENEEGG